MSGPLATIVDAQKVAQDRYHEELNTAEGPQEQQRAIERYYVDVDKNTEAVLELIRAHPRDPVVVEAARFVIRTARAGPSDKSKQAMEILARDHVRDPGMGRLCGEFFYFYHLPIAETLILDVSTRHPNREDRGLACHVLATYSRLQARWVRRLEREPERLADYEQTRGDDDLSIQATRALRPEALEERAEGLLERVVSEFGDVRYDPDSPTDTRSLGEVAAGELFALRHLAVGKVAPEIEGRDVDGREFRLSDYRGKVVVLTFSGNWCGPCRGEYPKERELVRRLADEPFALLSVNTDEDQATLRQSIEAGEVTWRCWWDGGTEGPITTRWGVLSFPTIYVLDPQGVIRSNDLRGEALNSFVSDLLAEVSDAKPGT